LAVEDIAAADLVYRHARQSRRGAAIG
jgi:ornithine cyclodeaminase/alanine dehydrogenase-like protein (mu-crystallin family)